MRENPGDLRFYKHTEKSRVWFVKEDIDMLRRLDDFTFDKKTIYSPMDYLTLPPNLKKIFEEDEPIEAWMTLKFSGGYISPELKVAADAQSAEIAQQKKTQRLFNKNGSSTFIKEGKRCLR